MRDFEKVENVVCAKDIRARLLKALNLGPGELATALGINYQRIYDLGSGRTKKFNPGMVNMICQKFPQVNPTFLYSGEGDVLLPTANNQPSQVVADSGASEIIGMSKKLIELMEQLSAKDAHLREREIELDQRAADLDERERALKIREMQLEKIAVE
jgi:hypothetical protein